jgi:hypothetical protein
MLTVARALAVPGFGGFADDLCGGLSRGFMVLKMTVLSELR